MKNNIQIYQTLFLSSILFFWVYFFSLDISIFEIGAVFFTVFLLEYIFLNGFRIKDIVFPYSGINAAFGICFFLRSDDIILYFFAASLAIVWKHLITIWWRHFLNPSNMAVFITLCIFQSYAWINTLQWWNYTGIIEIDYIVMFIVIIVLWVFMARKGSNILKYNYLFDYILPFIVLHFMLFFIIPYHESWSSFFLFFNISFFIFVFFMITDPKTIPERSISRSLYACWIVLHFYVLQFFIHEWYAILGSLFVTTLLLPILRFLEKRQYFLKYDDRFFLSFYNLFLLIVIGLCIHIYWQPDLVFDNTCNKLVCK